MTPQEVPDYARHYATWHPDTDAHYAEMDGFYARLLAPVLDGLARDARLLDVGCGMGLLVHALQAAGFADVKGVDRSAHQIAIAQRRGLPCRLSVNDDGEAGLGEPMDVIFLLDVLEHIPVADQPRFLANLRAQLVPGGRLVLSVPNANASFASRFRWGDWEHHSAFTEDSLAQVLHMAGFESVRLHRHEFGRALRFPYLHQPAFWTGLLRAFFRALRRLEAVAEFGRPGLHFPLSLNLLAECRRPARSTG